MIDNKSYQSIACAKTFLVRFLALLIPSIFIPFLVTTLHTANILVEHEKNPTSSQAFARLNDIVNPIAWQSRLDAAVYAHTLIDGIHQQDTNMLKKYLAWALKRIKHKPREGLYENSLLVLKTLGETKAYQLLLREAKRTFPQHSNWKNSILQPNKVDK